MLYLALLAFGLGLRHALEPDHLAAVTQAATQHGGPGRAWQGARLGLAWGLGHGSVLVVLVAALTIGGVVLPLGVFSVAEFIVGVWLVVVGALGVHAAWRDGGHGPAHEHVHGAIAHRHPSRAAHWHVPLVAVPLALRPLTFGALHGLAGSGALMAVAAVAAPTAYSRIGFAVAFGLGATLSMMLASAVAATGLAGLSASARRIASGAVGVMAATVGAWWMASATLL